MDCRDEVNRVNFPFDSGACKTRSPYGHIAVQAPGKALTFNLLLPRTTQHLLFWPQPVVTSTACLNYTTKGPMSMPREW